MDNNFEDDFSFDNFEEEFGPDEGLADWERELLDTVKPVDSTPVMLKSYLDDYDVSTVDVHPIIRTISKLLNLPEHAKPYETAVFKSGVLRLGFDAPVDEQLPLHIQEYDSALEAEAGHAEVIAALKTGTLVFNPPKF